jgi:hypothetical protein
MTTQPHPSKDPRNQERYCHISFFDGWQRVLLQSQMEYPGKRRHRAREKSATIWNTKRGRHGEQSTPNVTQAPCECINAG